MMKRICVILLIAIMCAGFNIRAQTPPGLSLDECIKIALEQNPLILSSLQQYQASLARVNQAKAFPQPSLNWDSDLQSRLFDFKNTGEWYFGLSQPIEFPGKRYLRGKIATQESDEFFQEINLLKLDIVFKVKHAFYSLLLAQEKLKSVQQDLDLSRDFLQKAELKYEAGDVAKVEVLRAKVETSKASNELRKVTNELRFVKDPFFFFTIRRKGFRKKRLT